MQRKKISLQDRGTNIRIGGNGRLGEQSGEGGKCPGTHSNSQHIVSAYAPYDARTKRTRKIDLFTVALP